MNIVARNVRDKVGTYTSQTEAPMLPKSVTPPMWPALCMWAGWGLIIHGSGGEIIPGGKIIPVWNRCVDIKFHHGDASWLRIWSFTWLGTKNSGSEVDMTCQGMAVNIARHSEKSARIHPQTMQNSQNALRWLFVDNAASALHISTSDPECFVPNQVIDHIRSQEASP